MDALGIGGFTFTNSDEFALSGRIDFDDFDPDHFIRRPTKKRRVESPPPNYSNFPFNLEAMCEYLSLVKDSVNKELIKMKFNWDWEGLRLLQPSEVAPYWHEVTEKVSQLVKVNENHQILLSFQGAYLLERDIRKGAESDVYYARYFSFIDRELDGGEKFVKNELFGYVALKLSNLPETVFKAQVELLNQVAPPFRKYLDLPLNFGVTQEGREWMACRYRPHSLLKVNYRANDRPVGLLIQLFAQVIQGCKALKPNIHCDVRGVNILVDGDNNVVITGFEALVKEGETAILGSTPGYQSMLPYGAQKEALSNYIENMPIVVGEYQEVYSLGVLLDGDMIGLLFDQHYDKLPSDRKEAWKLHCGALVEKEIAVEGKEQLEALAEANGGDRCYPWESDDGKVHLILKPSLDDQAFHLTEIAKLFVGVLKEEEIAKVQKLIAIARDCQDERAPGKIKSLEELERAIAATSLNVNMGDAAPLIT